MKNPPHCAMVCKMAASAREKANGLSLSYEGSVKLLPPAKLSSKYTKKEPEGIKPIQQNVKSGKAYVYGKRDIIQRGQTGATGEEDGSDSETVIEIKPRRPPKGRSHAKRERKQSSSQIIEEDVEPGETVQSLAIRYSCPVSEIRRVNNLYTDLDFYALKRVKIPVKSNSVLIEVHEQERRRQMAKERSAKEGEGVSSTDSDGLRASQQQVVLTEDEGCDADEEVDESDDNAVEKDYLLDREPSRVKLKEAFRWKDSVDTMLQRVDEKVDEVRNKNSERRAALQAAYQTDDRVQILLPPMGPSSANDALEHRLLSVDTESKKSKWMIFFLAAVIPALSIIVGIIIIYFCRDNKCHRSS